ncbi:T9SS type A sorting domain-containing protein [candidate division KSB1 bacterium]|nr:T9SS type A sorting domain-containing protein [candidate division KSB1 bacterium]
MMRFFLASMFGMLLILSFASNSAAQTGFPDWHAANMRWVEAGCDTHYFRSDNGSTLSWGETYNLQAYNLMYLADGDTLWLYKLAEHGFAIKNSAKDLPADTSLTVDSFYADGYLGWGNAQYSGEYDEYLVWDGHFCTEIAKFIRTVYEDDQLIPIFGARADTLLRFLEQHVAAKWYAIWYEPRTNRPGELATNDTYHRWIGGQNLDRIPVNRYTAFGNFLLELSRISMSGHYTPFNPEMIPWYRQVVTEMAQEFHDLLEYNPLLDMYLWTYSTESSSNDLSHSAIETGFAFDCYQNGIVFTETDMKRMGHTLTRHLWKNPGDFRQTELWDYFNQTETSGNGYDTYTRKWAQLGSIDPLVCAVESGVMRHFAESRNYCSGVYATGIAALAWVNRAAQPITAAISTHLEEIEGDGDRFPDPGEKLKLYISIANWGNKSLDSLSVSVACDDERIEFIKNTARYTEIASLDTIANEADPFIIQIKPEIDTGGVLPLLLEIRFGERTRVDSVSLTIGPVDVLLIDDDGGADFELAYQTAVLDSLCRFQYWNVETMGCPAQFLNDFEKIIWFTGEQDQNTLTPEDRDAIKAYLNQGGKMIFFSKGAEGDLLDSEEPDSLFFRDYLHALPSIRTISNKWVTLRTVISEFYPTPYLVLGAIDNFLFRAIEPGPDAASILKYPFGCAALYTTRQHRMAYVTFGIEHLKPDNTVLETYQKRRHVMRKLLEMVDEIDAHVIRIASIPAKFELTTFPNPFSDRLTVEFLLPGKAGIELSVYNIRGRLVKRVFSGMKSAGTHQLAWDGFDEQNSPVSNGLYLLRFRTDEVKQTYKICHIR